MIERPTFNEVVGAALAVVSVGVVSYQAIFSASDQAEGAVIALLAAAVGWLYRGRVKPPETGEGGARGRP